jgi:hypothetical protein
MPDNFIDRTFLEDYGPYRPYKQQLPSYLRLAEANGPPIQLHCPTCDGERTWNEEASIRHVVGLSSDNSPVGAAFYVTAVQALGEGVRDVSDTIVSYYYRCNGCHTAHVTFMIYFVATKCHDRRLQERALYAKGKMEQRSLIKVGQHPMRDIKSNSTLREALGDNEKLYRKGLVSQEQGYGIGAFSYFRRVVDNIIDTILTDIESLLPPQEQATFAAQLAKAQNSKVAADKIEMVKDLVPPILCTAGVNPLNLLYSELSIGLHVETDEECLDKAALIRTCLERLISLLHVQKEQGTAYTKQVQALLDRRSQRPPTT